MANKSRWKDLERDVARFFGCKRTPLSGGNSGHNTTSDTLHDTLYIECKKRKRFSLIELWRKINKSAITEKKFPVIAIKDKGGHGFWLLVHCDDLQIIANQREIVEK